MAGKSKIDALDIVGTKFGSLRVVQYIGKQTKYHWYLADCDCGSQKKYRRQNFIKPFGPESCGCKRNLRSGERIKTLNLRHGLSRASIYNRWSSMLARCNNPASKKYERYGKRGITVCERWKNFDAFFQDMGHPPTAHHSIDRIDVNGNYEPSNCRWATQKTQQNNRGNTRFITFQGETKTITEWAELVGIEAKIIRQRLDRDKWSVDRALSKQKFPKGDE